MKSLVPVALLAALAMLPACQAAQSNAPAPHHGAMWSSVTKATAILTAVNSKAAGITGAVTFTDVADGVKVEGAVSGLAPRSTHAFHIHQFGDISGADPASANADGMSVGAHYNPAGHHHGAPDAPEHHAGDLGNITADDKGVAHINVTIKGISVAGMTNPIVGRGVVVHEGVDDLKTDPTGNAGGRIAVGVVGIAKTATTPTIGTRPAKK